MKYDRAFAREESRLLSTALKSREFSRSLPEGMGERLATRIRAANSGAPRWWKIAASVAAVASFAAFAATVAVKFVGVGDGGENHQGDAPVQETIEIATCETFDEIFSEELAELRKQEEIQAMNTRAVKGLAAGALVAATAFSVPSAQGDVRSSVFDDVKVWYKGSAGNAVGTKDVDSNSGGTSKIMNLTDLSSGNIHGGTYNYWAWRMKYANEKVDCPYAGVTLDSTPCMVVPVFLTSVGKKEDVTMTINGNTVTRTVWTGRRFCNLYFNNWMNDWESGTVCSNWTCVLRFRSNPVMQASGNCNKVIDIGTLWDATAGKATGVNFLMNTPDPDASGVLADYASPRTYVTTTQMNYTDIKIKHNRWVDCALVVNGQTLTMWFCWNDGTEAAPTNKLAKITETYPTTKGLPTIAAKCRVNLASTGGESFNGNYTNGVYSAALARKGFEGAFHQIAFWDRTLSDDEIREAMAGGTSRPNLVQVGIEGNGIKEFAATPSRTSVATDGDWENLNPTLTAENPSATITFDCPALWAGLPQYLRLPMASTSSSGAVDITLNGTSLGTVEVYAGKTSFVYIEGNKILSGANTLVITRASGDALVLDAVTLGGSAKFGDGLASFATSAEANSLGPDKYLFHPACGNDKLHARGLSYGKGNKTYFDFYVPEDLVGKCRGIFATCAQNTSNAEKDFHFYVNDVKVGEYKIKGDVTTEVKVPSEALVAGWNQLSWESQSGGDWANIDWHKFTVLPPKKGMMIIIK